METKRALIYLMACTAHDTAPDLSLLEGTDFEAVYRMSVRHKLTAVCAYVLEKAFAASGTGAETIMPREVWESFLQKKGMALRRMVMFDAERKAIFKDLDSLGIWYVPLKGIITQTFYPAYGIREMADNDILYDQDRQFELRDYMHLRGYTDRGHIGMAKHDSYEKVPVFNFEFHVRLFDVQPEGEAFYNYFQELCGRKIKDGEGLGYHFGDDDFYIYVTAHAFHHYDKSGTGLRTLLDNYLHRKAMSGKLDWEYIEKGLNAAGLAEFERTMSSLADKLFSEAAPFEEDSLSPEEQKMLLYMAGSGTYGTQSNAVKNTLKKIGNEYGSGVNAGAKFKYFIRRTFPSIDHMRHYSDFLNKYPVFIPAGYIYRIIKASTVDRKRIGREVKVLKNAKDESGAPDAAPKSGENARE